MPDCFTRLIPATFSAPRRGAALGPEAQAQDRSLWGRTRLAAGEQARGTRERADGLPGPVLGGVSHGEGGCPTNLAEPALPGGRTAPRRTAGRPGPRPAPAAPRAAAGIPAGSASGSTPSASPRSLRGGSHQLYTFCANETRKR